MKDNKTRGNTSLSDRHSVALGQMMGDDAAAQKSEENPRWEMELLRKY